MPNIVVTPSDPPSVHRILYLPQATKEHFKLKLVHYFKIKQKPSWYSFFWLIKRGVIPVHFDQKVVFEEVHFWQGGFNISPSWIMGTLLRLKTNSANFLIWRWKSETQLLANFYNALVDSVLKLYRPLIWYTPTVFFFNDLFSSSQICA